MSDVQERVVVETIEHLDFDLPCSVEDCDEAADFSVLCRFCDDVSLGCEAHVRRLIELNTITAGAFQCRTCLHVENDLWALACIHPLKR
ncbi:hypothetical protein ASF48_05120 [Rathayibacter sp. Leaf299]|uniref:hypothetical protein n=1 Tax=Rathayibacter sp. Leaf299 TaxID=1736328 RepID=UPI0006FA12FA|nr:hypothetical protein [Rathayibacter sp. Leaf299]KQQ22567.1 hypothetical protein ASF48_05120 [Rathayibacter sp. Leaf299]